jgi:hypothetical protein
MTGPHVDHALGSAVARTNWRMAAASRAGCSSGMRVWQPGTSSSRSRGSSAASRRPCSRHDVVLGRPGHQRRPVEAAQPRGRRHYHAWVGGGGPQVAGQVGRIAGWPSSGAGQASVTSWGWVAWPSTPGRAAGSVAAGAATVAPARSARPAAGRPARRCDSADPGEVVERLAGADDQPRDALGVLGGGELEQARVVADQGHLAQVRGVQELGLEPERFRGVTGRRRRAWAAGGRPAAGSGPRSGTRRAAGGRRGATATRPSPAHAAARPPGRFRRCPDTGSSLLGAGRRARAAPSTSTGAGRTGRRVAAACPALRRAPSRN